MRISQFIGIILLACTFSAKSIAVDKKKSLLPVEIFASEPNIADLKISPNGEMIAYAIDYEDRKAIVIKDTAGQLRGIMPAPEGAEYNYFLWANDETLIIQVFGTLKRQAFRGMSRETRLHAFNIADKKVTWLGELRNGPVALSSRIQHNSQNERLVDILPDDPNHILVEMDYDLDAASSVYKVNINTGARKVAHQDVGGIQHWYTDLNSEIRYGFGYSGDKFKSRFKNADGKWIDLNKTEWNKYYDFEDFTEIPNIIYVKARTDYGTNGIYTLDLQSGKLVNLVFANEKVDIDGVFHHPITGKTAGVYYTTDYSKVKYFDQKLDKIQRSLENVLPDMAVSIVSMAADVEKYIVLAENDREPGIYFFYDRDNGRLDQVARSRPQINHTQMATVKLVDIPVRDSSTIPAFITTPITNGPTNLPAVILLHGGPAARDSAEWNYWAQFIANRGYLVLQPNFRGSSGYGDTFEYKGKNQWGGLMQDDVTDATKWLISQGYADPKRICIAGASYGGYAALMGVIKEQDLYKCAISVNGVTDLPRLKRADKRESVGGKAWVKTMGLKGSDDKDVSPHHRAKEVNAPVLLMSSKDDARVNYKMSRDMHKKLKKLCKDSTYIKIEDGTHFMLTENSRMTLLTETEKFLAKHIGN